MISVSVTLINPTYRFSRFPPFCFQPLLIQSPESTLSAISDTLCLAGLAGLAKDGHKPDKLDTWKYAPESDGWYRIHNALRGEMFKFEAVLEKLA